MCCSLLHNIDDDNIDNDDDDDDKYDFDAKDYDNIDNSNDNDVDIHSLPADVELLCVVHSSTSKHLTSHPCCH